MKNKMLKLRSKVREMIINELSEQDKKSKGKAEDVENVDVDIEAPETPAPAQPELSQDEQNVQDNLQKALEAARSLGDDKLIDQIGNTITFFTRTHVVKGGNQSTKESQDLQEYNERRMKKIAGIIK